MIMHPLRSFSVAFGLIAFSAGGTAMAAEKFDLERVKPVPAGEQIPALDFFRPELLTDATLNPSGTHIAAIITAAQDRGSLLVTNLDTQKIETLQSSVDKDMYDVRWLDDQRLLYHLATEKLYGVGMFVADVGNLTRAYPIFQLAGARLVSVREKQRRRPLVWVHTEGLDRGVVVANTDLNTGALRNFRGPTAYSSYMDVKEYNERHIVEEYGVPPGGMTTRYLADKDGELAYAFTTVEGYTTMHQLVGREWKKCPVDLDQIDIVTSGNRAGEVVVLGPREEGKPRALQFMDAATGTLGEVLIRDIAYDFNGYIYRDPNTHLITGVAYDRNGPQVTWFTEADKTLQKVIQNSFPNQVARIVDRSRSGERFLVRTFSDRHPAAYHWVDLAKRSMGLVKNSAPWIDPERMQPMQILKFTTRDGRKLDAYLTLPAGTTKEKPAPLVVLPHGGPYVRDTWGFNGEVQFLANRGYAVLQPNYRGSTGYDWMFPESDKWDFRKMHDDVTDAAKSALKLGLVDPNRVAIMGASFGGYLALSGVVHEPTFYRCAVSIAGVFDWAQMLRERKYEQFDDPSYGWIKRRLGDPKKEEEKFAAISPVRHVANVRVPMFVSHGKEDYVAEVGQSRRLIGELKKHNVPHEVLLVGGEGHGMGFLENRVKLYTRIEAFLAKNLAPARASAPGGTAAGAP